MNAEKKTCNSIIQLDNGSNYEIIESVDFIETLMNDEFIMDNTFLTFHFPDEYECKVRKNRIVAFYEDE